MFGLTVMLAASVALGPKTASPPVVVTLGEGVRAVFADRAYKVEYAKGLEDSANRHPRHRPHHPPAGSARPVPRPAPDVRGGRFEAHRVHREGLGLEPPDRATQIHARLAELPG